MNIRKPSTKDFEQIWPVFHEIVATGETYAFARETAKGEAFSLWMYAAGETSVYEENGQILGPYIIKTNQMGPGNHVANCGYMVASAARGRGIATALCKHSQVVAKRFGYKAML